MKTISPILFILFFCISTSVVSQTYVTKAGTINFFSETPVEDIQAKNFQVNAALDISNGNFVFKVLIRSFEFKKALMQEHFNENYMESDKFPKATFVGVVENISAMDFLISKAYEATIKGKLTIHGVTNEITMPATLEQKDGNIVGHAEFIAKPADYKIKIPKAMWENIAESIEVTVDIELQKKE